MINANNISSVQYQSIEGENISVLVTFNNGKNLCVPINNDNTDYQEIVHLVESGDLTIADAE